MDLEKTCPVSSDGHVVHPVGPDDPDEGLLLEAAVVKLQFEQVYRVQQGSRLDGKMSTRFAWIMLLDIGR